MAARKPPSSLDELQGLRGRDWIRESTETQFDRHDGNAQRRNCEAFRDRYGVVQSGPAYVVAHSGKTVWKSPTMIRLLDDVRSGSIDVLVTGYFDRWQRNLRRTLEIVEDVLHPNGVSWVMADRRLISGNERDWNQMVKQAHEAATYLDDLRDKVKDGYEAKREVRHDQGGGLVPVGFRRDPDTKLVVPDLETMPLAVRVWELSAQAWTDAAIAAETGITLWQVRKVLQSPLFAGLVRPGIPTNFPAPIKPELREQAAAHRQIRNRVGNRVRTYRVYPLSGGGPVICDDCKKAVKGDTKVRRDRTRVHVYRHAASSLRDDGTVCTGWRVKEVASSVLEDQVARLFDRAAPSPESTARIRAALERPTASIDRLAVARVDGRLKLLGQELAAACPSRPDAEILAEIAVLRIERQTLVKTPIEPSLISPDEAVIYLASLGRLWRETDDDGRRRLAVATFATIGVRSSDRRGSHKIVSFELTPDAVRMGSTSSWTCRI